MCVLLYFIITKKQSKESCNLPKENGDCGEKHARWSFSQDDNKCMPFYYTGCGGNDNNYETETICAEKCPAVIGEREKNTNYN